MQQPARHVARLDYFHDQPWADRALCAQTDPDAFFPDKGGSTRDPKKVCQSCDVRQECLEWALATDQAFGIWGGHSERERRKLKKEQPALAATGTDGPAYDVVDQATDLDEKPAPVHYGGTYVGGTGHRPVPLATDIGIRPAHTPRAPRPTGLDWSKHTAPAPETPAAAEQPVEWPCRWCRTTSAELVDDMCPDCRHEAEQQFTVPTIPQEQTCPVQAATGSPTADGSAAVHQPAPATAVTRPTRTTGPKTTPAEAPTLPASQAPDVVDYCARLLRDTATSPDPLVQMLRGSALSVLAALDHAHHPTQTPAAAEPPRAAAGPKPRAPRAATARRPRPAARATVDLAKAKELLAQGRSCPQIAQQLGVNITTLRRQLQAAGVPIPDGRATHSGGQPRTYDDQTIADVRRLYLDEHQSRSQVAFQLGLPYKTVVTIMTRHNIPARQRQAGNLDGARTLKQQIAGLGVSSRDIKTWALAQGLITELKRGLPGLELVDAYAAAHPTTTKENA